jgi:hypothetical protein
MSWPPASNTDSVPKGERAIESSSVKVHGTSVPSVLDSHNASKETTFAVAKNKTIKAPDLNTGLANYKQ